MVATSRKGSKSMIVGYPFGIARYVDTATLNWQDLNLVGQFSIDVTSFEVCRFGK
jgi:hypothetical protein